MKNIKYTFFCLLFFFFSCTKEVIEEVTVEGQSRPVINFVTPSINDEIIIGTSVEIKIKATDKDNDLSKLQFYIEDELISEIEVETENDTLSIIHAWDTDTLSSGAYSLKAIATDDNGNTEEKELSIILSNEGVSLINDSVKVLLNKATFYVQLMNANDLDFDEQGIVYAKGNSVDWGNGTKLNGSISGDTIIASVELERLKGYSYFAYVIINGDTIVSKNTSFKMLRKAIWKNTFTKYFATTETVEGIFEAVGNKLYYGTGLDINQSPEDEIYSLVLETGYWEQETVYPGGATYNAVSASYDGKLIIGLGVNQEMHAYDGSTWTTLSSPSEPIYRASHWQMDSLLFVVSRASLNQTTYSFNTTGYDMVLWKYNILTDTWTKLDESIDSKFKKINPIILVKNDTITITGGNEVINHYDAESAVFNRSISQFTIDNLGNLTFISSEYAEYGKSGGIGFVMEGEQYLYYGDLLMRHIDFSQDAPNDFEFIETTFEYDFSNYNNPLFGYKSKVVVVGSSAFFIGGHRDAGRYLGVLYELKIP